MDLDKRFSIGEAAKATGVKVVTIRYYEQIGLMPKPMRTKGNYRTYNQEHLAGYGSFAGAAIWASRYGKSTIS